MKKLNLHYIAGLIDADGSLSISLSCREHKSSSVSISPVINLRQLTQYKNVLEGVQSTLGKGKIYRHVENMSTWQTTTQEDALEIAELLYPYLHIKKDTCKRFIDILKKWNGKDFNRHSSRRKHQPARPLWLVNEMLDVAMNLNKNRQTKTAYKNKAKRVNEIKRNIKKFYENSQS